MGSTYETLRQPLIHYFTHTVGEDDAEDLCHDLFLTLIGRLAQRVQIQAMDHYLWRAARFRAIDTQPGALWARERRREPFGRGGFCRERRRERRRDPFGRGGLAPPAYP